MNKTSALRRLASLEQRLADLEEQLATVEEGHQAHSLFDEYDYNQDGLIDSAEWGGSPELFQALDTDMDGVLTPSEIGMGMGNSFSKLAKVAKHKGLARRRLKAHNLFETYDLNMDGFIDSTEWGGSMDAFDALDTNMDSLLDNDEIAMGVGPSFARQASNEYLSPQEMADLMGGTLISKQASRRNRRRF
jgi:Ca2+-binding EF-hand superfamily protein